METKLNSLLPNYKFIKKIGTGTYGKVYFIKERNTDKYYAIKVLSKSKIILNNQIENIYSEYIITKQISHPFVVPLQKFIQDNINIYFLFNFIPGGELLTLMRNEVSFSECNTQFYIAQLISVIDYLHKMKIIYRDLKPENILIDATGYLKLVDYGISKQFTEVCKTYTLCGTPTYIAPEIFLRKGYSFNIDWWALGVLCYEMITGIDPWNTDDPSEIYDKIINGKIYFKKDLNNNIKNFIQRLLVGDPQNRLGTNYINGVNEIYMHKWFKGFDWNALENKTLVPWYIPKLKYILYYNI